MKTMLFIHAAFLTFLNITFNFMPPVHLFGILGVSMLLDLITGVAKAVYMGDARTSNGYRKTLIKTTQYMGSICVTLILRYLLLKQPELMNGVRYVNWIANGLIVFIILIECTSILENLYAINKTSIFARIFIKPFLMLLTIQFRKFFQNEITTNENL
jgi:phage-related holin